ncbi:hypothetical protein [Solirhodobacter olei]|uniref:hypothetical protein n=1 Tax=Solirhodobacter olei TaxID=2493082 RepID=UPI000FDC4865|nr:hypothetical protein [Solirhodobacter olei]
MLSGRQVAFLKALAIAIVGTVVIWFGAAAIILGVFAHDMQAAAPWLALAKVASLAWAAAVGWMIIWPRLDEREKEARKFSWLIGSTTAILLTAPIMLLWLENGGAFLTQLVHRHTPGIYFALGWVGLVFAQLLSSLVARAWWWAAKR